MMNGAGRIVMLENMAVSIFGAFVGGDAVNTWLRGVAKDSTFSVSALALSAAGAVTMLVLLRLMRVVVGPLRSGKSKARR